MMWYNDAEKLSSTANLTKVTYQIIFILINSMKSGLRLNHPPTLILGTWSLYRYRFIQPNIPRLGNFTEKKLYLTTYLCSCGLKRRQKIILISIRIDNAIIHLLAIVSLNSTNEWYCGIHIFPCTGYIQYNACKITAANQCLWAFASRLMSILKCFLC